MKDLTIEIEEKAKRYDEVIERANSLLSGNQIGNAWIYKLLPELKESEDEKIRKELIQFVKDYPNLPNGKYCRTDFFNWLEKQGKNNIGISDATKQKLEDSLNKALEKETPESWNEFLDEQKPADKFEPKFKVGDWCIDNVNNTVFQITKVISNLYYYKTNEGKEYSCITWCSLENDARLWTIQDAKDGDILELDCGIGIFKDKCIDGCNIHCYCYYSNQCVLEINKDSLYDTYQSHPATKEQRDLLFQKMKEAGYEWDAEKKEVRKIEPKPAWSTEDEIYLLDVIEWVTNLIDDEDCGDMTYDEHKEFYMKRISWLKSLKERMKK